MLPDAMETDMTRIGILLGCAALVAASAAPAQLLGGGGIGGGGGLGGGLGGAMGNVGGNLNGGAGTLRSQQLSDVARADRIHARELRQEQRRAERAGRGGNIAGNVAGGVSGSPGTLAGGIPGGGSGTIGRVAGSGNGAPSGDSGRVAGSGGGGLSGDLASRVTRDVNLRSYADRADASAVSRGLKRAGRSASGVSIYLPAAAVGVPVVVAQPYPVYAGSTHYDGGYYGGGTTYRDTRIVVAASNPGYMDRQYEDLRDDTAGTGVTVERRGRDLVVQLPADITFAFDRADIQPRFVTALDAVARTIAGYRGTDVEVIGHTDSSGSDAYNYALSQRRGSSVADFLVSRRAEPDRLIVEAMGESEPVATNATTAGRAANRRVEIILHPHAA